ncbi:hypothetical protein [Pectobacterium parmentieri]|uniref:hypothetical protein n=1 Tax=Pectobacterium parmentieri TaxID=1905730 RepID=UPI000473DDF8|nr:hypothetical protein [Pectobacterium parmentieri]PWD59765.1 hypothetical protein DF211_17545 [Pectobacterium parmentieri]
MTDHFTIADNLIFRDEKTGEVVIFNYFTWVEVIKGVIFKYTEKSKEDIDFLVASHSLVKNANSNYISVVLCSHEVEYHWAMLIVYGELYWNYGVTQNEPDGYWDWETDYRKFNDLAEDSFVFID